MTKATLHQNNRIIGRLLRSHRIVQSYSQAQAGALLGISFQQFQKYENGTNRISAASLLTLSCAWDTPVSEFFPNGEISDPKIDPEAPKADLMLLRDL